MPTRERIAACLRWRYLKWVFGVMNTCAMLPQLVRLVMTRQTAGISITMFWIILAVQLAYSFDGFLTRNRMLMVTLAGASTITTSIIILYYASS